MTFQPDPLTDPLNDWLDARATGQVPPAAPDADADFDALLVTARRLDRLARQNEEVARSHRHRSTWEETMSTANPTISPTPHHPIYRSTGPSIPRSLPLPTHHRWWKVALGAVAALVLLASAWVTGTLNGFLPGGGSGEPEQLAYLSFAAQGEEQRFEIAEIPEAAECTVEPMTVDEVMAALQGYTPQAPILGTPTVSPTPSDVKWTGPEGGAVGRATPDLIAQAEEVFRQWVACHRAGDLFRAWSLESIQYFRESILRMYGPVLSFETIRADLELMAADADAETPLSNLQLANDALVPMLVTSGWDSLVVNAPYGPLRIPVYWQSLDGEIAGVPGYLTQDQWEDPAYDPFRGKFLWNNAEFVLDAETGQMLIWDINANNAG